MRTPTITLLTIATLFLVSCGAHIKVEGSFPRPLVPPVDAAVQLVLTPEFTEYVFTQDKKSRKKLTIELGSAQTQLFQTVVPAMFTGNGDVAKITIKPSLEDFQYAIPRETSSEIYEIWLKYRIQITSSEGDAIADWMITGYGKTPTAMLKSKQTSMSAASIIALRDIGSQLSIGFGRQNDIKQWLEKQS